MDNLSLVKKLPPMLSGSELEQALTILPEYDPTIVNGNEAMRLIALTDIYKVFVPNQMSREIYSKLYLALLRSLQKKEGKLRVKQDIVEGDLLDKDGKFYVTCTFGTEVEQTGNESIETFGQYFSELDKINKQNLSAEELFAKKQELLDKLLSVQRKQIEKNNYAEIYVHIDMKNRQLGFAMKSPAYQLPILRLLTDTASIDE